MNVTLVNTQFLMDGGGVTYTVIGDDPFNTQMLRSTEADIRATMAVPADNWGNADALVDCQAKVDAKYPAWGFTVVAPGAT